MALLVVVDELDWMNFLSIGARVALPPHHLVVTLTALFAKV